MDRTPGFTSSQRRFTFKGIAAVLFATATLAAGCGGPEGVVADTPLHQVKGSVKLEGAGSLVNLKIVFAPTTAGGRSASGEVHADGTFDLTTKSPGDGICEGDYNVHLEKTVPDAKGGKSAKPSIPLQYLDPEGAELTATIKADTTEVGPFVLSSKSKKTEKGRD